MTCSRTNKATNRTAVLAPTGIKPLFARLLFILPLVATLALGAAPVQAGPTETFEEGFSAFARQDMEKSFRLFKQAAEAGNTSAQIYLGAFYRQGIGTEKNPREALRWISILARKGEKEAQFTLGEMHEKGEGTPKDRDEALRWYRKAAQQGLAEAIARLEQPGSAAEQTASKTPETNTAASPTPAQQQVLDKSKVPFPKRKPEITLTPRQRLHRTAEAGDAEAQLTLWSIHETEGNLQEALKWIKEAAKNGQPEAQYTLADLYYYGEDLPQDYIQARNWYHKAAEQGHAESMTAMGLFYIYGEGVPKDTETALYWFRLAAKNGNAMGQYVLADHYLRGMGVEQDRAKARYWFKLAADQDFEYAVTALAKLEQTPGSPPKEPAKKPASKPGSKPGNQAKSSGASSGIRMPETPEDFLTVAREFYHEGDLENTFVMAKIAAQGGHEDAQYMISEMYRKGKGTPADQREAFFWIKKAAEQGNPDYQYMLALDYEDGNGTIKDMSQALKWYRKSAEQSLPEAQYILGIYYNLKSSPPDYKEGFHWVSRAANQNLPEAEYQMGEIYLKGLGRPEDIVEAMRWYDKAARQGFEPAQKRREQILALLESRKKTN